MPSCSFNVTRNRLRPLDYWCLIRWIISSILRYEARKDLDIGMRFSVNTLSKARVHEALGAWIRNRENRWTQRGPRLIEMGTVLKEAELAVETATYVDL